MVTSTLTMARLTSKKQTFNKGDMNVKKTISNGNGPEQMYRVPNMYCSM